jgi:hypothetical protein
MRPSFGASDDIFRVPIRRLVTFAVCAYAVSSVVLWLAVDTLADRAWWATLVAFGPRWLAVSPVLPLVLIIAVVTSGRMASRLIGVVTLSAFSGFGIRINHVLMSTQCYAPPMRVSFPAPMAGITRRSWSIS